MPHLCRPHNVCDDPAPMLADCSCAHSSHPAQNTRRKLTIAYLFFVILTLSCLVRGTSADGLVLTLAPRGTGSRSPSPSRGGGPMHESTGLLGDIVRQGMRRPASPVHPSPSTHAHPAHSTQPTQSQPQHHAESAAPPKKKRPGAPTWDAPHQALPSLGRLGAQVQQVQPGLHTQSAKPSRGRTAVRHIPLQVMASSAHGGGHAQPAALPKPHQRTHAGNVGLPQSNQGPHGGEKKSSGRTTWWKQAGGVPPKRQGSSPQFETKRKYREKQKLKSLGHHVDQHPSGHQQHPPPRGGSPGGGSSHAVSK